MIRDVDVPDQATPLRMAGNIAVKLEAFNPAGSHKSRAARHIVTKAVSNNRLVRGDGRRLLEKTGGNLGVGLAYEARRHGIGVDLVVGRSFSPIKRKLCEIYGVCIVGRDLINTGLSPRQVIETLMVAETENYVFTDQFTNPANLEAHLAETGPELVDQLAQAGQLRGTTVIFVAGAGTGASFEGVSRSLAARVTTLVRVLVVPDGCDPEKGIYRNHPIDGFAVGPEPSFVDFGSIAETISVSDHAAYAGQEMLAQAIGFFPGVSSGANYTAALRLAKRFPKALIVTIAYDVGDAYLARRLAAAA